MPNPKFNLKYLGKKDYQETWEEMKVFTENRSPDTQDELWILEHPPVFTLGLAGKKEHLLFLNHDIPIIHCDRGGQVTYHAPGQLIVYLLIDLKRNNLSIRTLVEKIENGVIQYLESLQISAHGDRNAPGVYVDGKKIASLGLKVKKGCTYHGLSFNIAMDLTPFNYINVCGYSGLKVTQLSTLTKIDSFENVIKDIIPFITASIYGTSING